MRITSSIFPAAIRAALLAKKEELEISVLPGAMSFPIENILKVLEITGSVPTRFMRADDCQTETLYIVQNDTVKIRSRSDYGAIIEKTVTEQEARQWIVEATLGRMLYGCAIGIPDANENESSYTVYDLVEDCCLSVSAARVADAIFVGWLMADEYANAKDLFGEGEEKTETITVSLPESVRQAA